MAIPKKLPGIVAPRSSDRLPRHSRGHPGGGDKRVALALILFGIAALAAFLRIFSYFDRVFIGDLTRFPSTDPWTHVRQVEFLVRHFPYRLTFDPYGAFPDGQPLAVAPLLDYFAAGLALMMQALTGSPKATPLACAFLPPLLAAATTTAGYGIGRMMFNRAVGLLAAVLIAITPGVLFASSVLGFLDHHILEALLSTVVMAALLSAYTSTPPNTTAASERTDCRPAKTASSKRTPLLRSLVFGLLLFLYLTTWIGGSFLVLLIGGWITVQAFAEHLSGRDVSVLRRALCPGLMLTTTLMIPLRAAYPMAGHQLVVLIIVLGLAFGLPLVSEIARRFAFPRAVFIALVGATAPLLALVIYSFDASLFDRVLSGLTPGGAASPARTIGEVQSLLWDASRVTLAPAWRLFATGYPLALIGLAVLIYRAFRFGRAADLLLLTWSGGVMLAMLGQLRFGYYAAVNVALLSAYVCIKAVEHAHIIPAWLLAESTAQAREAQDGMDAKAMRSSVLRAPLRHPSRGSGAVLLLWLAAIALAPPVYVLIENLGRFTGPNDAWVEALLWMRRETPEPFGDEATYFDPPPVRNRSEGYAPPSTAYGVMCWWDYGYWVTGLARRIPNANPTQYGASRAGRLYTATNDAEARTILNKAGSRYIIVDDALPFLSNDEGDVVGGKFEALARWGGRDLGVFYETVLHPDAAGHMQQLTLYYPAYFQTMAVRLYLYGGKQFDPDGPVHVAQFVMVRNEHGPARKRLQRILQFDSYAQAAAFVAEPEHDGAVLVSDDPTRSCIPLEAIDWVRPAYDSTATRSINGRKIARVRIFEIQRDAEGPTN